MIDELPPPKQSAVRAIRDHLSNWLEGYMWVPLSLLMIWGFAEFAYFLTGRRPTENVDWIVGVAASFVKAILCILLCSIFREATGVWLTKAERVDNPRFSIAQMASSAIALWIFAYLLSH